MTPWFYSLGEFFSIYETGILKGKVILKGNAVYQVPVYLPIYLHGAWQGPWGRAHTHTHVSFTYILCNRVSPSGWSSSFIPIFYSSMPQCSFLLQVLPIRRIDIIIIISHWDELCFKTIETAETLLITKWIVIIWIWYDQNQGELLSEMTVFSL